VTNNVDDDTKKNTNNEESPRSLLAMIKSDVVAAAGLVALGANAGVDRDAVIRKLADADGTIDMLVDAIGGAR
jgi:hypothetical protein